MTNGERRSGGTDKEKCEVIYNRQPLGNLPLDRYTLNGRH